MHYPFRFKLGDRVRVSPGQQHEGLAGTVTALELSEKRTMAVVHVSTQNNYRKLRFAESVLEAA